MPDHYHSRVTSWRTINLPIRLDMVTPTNGTVIALDLWKGNRDILI